MCVCVCVRLGTIFLIPKIKPWYQLSSAVMNMCRSTDPNSGFCPDTKIFHSLRPRTPFPPEQQPLSLAQYVFSLLRTAPHSPLETADVLIDASSGYRLSYSQFFRQVQSLAASLRRLTSLSKGDTAYILCPASLKIPVIYFSLLSLGVTISPANPIGSASEVSHQIRLCRPSIAFASSQTAHKLPSLRLGTVLVDSQEFDSMLTDNGAGYGEGVEVNQSDPAAILFSSGTTGRLKGVLLTHRNLITVMAGVYHNRQAKEEDAPHPVSLLTLPLFHVFGFFMLIRAVSLAETLVLMERFNLENMLKAVEKYRITYMPVSPPLVLALTKSDLALKYDLSSLQLLSSGGAPLGKELSERFTSRFPNIQMIEGFGMTEIGGGATGMEASDEAKLGSVGRLMADMEAKIVDPNTGEAQPPGQQGELWLRGPSVMRGYVGDDEATAATLNGEGWLKTGDLCYFDSEGFLYIVDRLKELIKYKAYQVPPAELEPLLQSNPEIADAAVIPYPDEEAGEIPMAFIVRKPGSRITESQVMEFIAKQVAPYKKIRRVAFIGSIPKSAAGKILRRELVNQAISKPGL